jgi:hypothetical protein
MEMIVIFMGAEVAVQTLSFRIQKVMLLIKKMFKPIPQKPHSLQEALMSHQ